MFVADGLLQSLPVINKTQTQLGCTSISSDTGPDKSNIRITLLDYLDTTQQLLTEAGHTGGPQCRCNQCDRLKRIEDKWIMRLGTFFGESGLNVRDEIVTNVRVNFKS